MPFLIWLWVLSMWPFFIDLAYIFPKFLPVLLGGRQPMLEDFGLLLLVFPAIVMLSTLLCEILVVLAAICAKWLLLGRFQEGSYSVGHLYLFFFEVCFLLTSAAQKAMQNNSQTIVNNLFMKAHNWARKCQC